MAGTRTNLREKLGESLASVQHFDKPLNQDEHGCAQLISQRHRFASFPELEGQGRY
jgi:hypothetical protein